MMCTLGKMYPGQIVRLLISRTFFGAKSLVIPRGRVIILISDMVVDDRVVYGQFLISNGVVGVLVTSLPLDQIFEIVG